LIGTTSAITGQVVGHVKTCLIIAGGFVFYPPANFSIRDVKNIMGILIAIVGMILYGHIKASALFPIIAMVIRVLMITIYTH
jgi:solute carrier family 35, member E3